MEGKPGPIFRPIADVALILDVSQHVLRLWEEQIPEFKPLRSRGGRRRYRPEDVDFLMGVRVLLHVHGLTMNGAKKIIRERGFEHVRTFWRQEGNLFNSPP